MKLSLMAPNASEAQQLCGLQAAEAIFLAEGLSAISANSACFEAELSLDVLPSPAQVRAARVWRAASTAALVACYGAKPQAAEAKLLVNP